MVFQSLAHFVRSRGPDEFWRKRKIFKLSSHFFGRRRNCYTIAIKIVHRAMVYATKGRQLKKDDMIQLWNTRITAGCEQFGIELPAFREGLHRNDIMLNRKTLADLACWEPKTFEALALTSREKAAQDALRGLHEKDADNKLYYFNDETKSEASTTHQ